MSASKLTIVGAEVYLTKVPTKRPHQMAIGTTRYQESVFLRLDTSAGVSGWGEAPHMVGHSHAGETQATVALQLRERLIPAILGQDATHIEAIRLLLDRTLPMNPRAKSAIDMALYDLVGRAMGLPVSGLLGGAVRDRIPLSWSIGSMPPGEAAAEARRMVADGFGILKVKVGARDDWRGDVECVLAVRDAVGDGVRIRADANQGYDVKTAIRAIRAMSEADLESMEQPVHRLDLEGMAEVRRSVDCYVMVDEGANTPEELYAVARHRAADIVSIYINTGGGIGAAHRMGVVAEAAGMIAYLGGALEGPVAARACMQFGAATPALSFGCEMSGQFLLEADLGPRIPFEDGALLVGDGPGLDVELDMDAVSRHQVDRFTVSS